MKIIDLEELKPERTGIKIKSFKTKKVYNIPIIYNATVMLVQQKYKNKPERLDIETVSAVCMATYPEMTTEWIEENFSQDDVGNFYMIAMYNFNYSREQAQKITFSQDVKKKKKKCFLVKLFRR